MHSSARAITLTEAVFPGTGLLRDAALVVAFTGLTVFLAQIAIRLPFTTVPITGQTLAALLTGAALGSKRGPLSMLLYALLGTVGAPVFAPSSAALQNQTVHLILPWQGTGQPIWELSSGGYIVGFVFAAWVVGILAERGWDRKAWVSTTMLLGNAMIYIFGLVWLGYIIASNQMIPGLGKTYQELIPGASILEKTLIGGLYPFIPGDLFKLLIASLVLPGAWELVDRIKGKRSTS